VKTVNLKRDFSEEAYGELVDVLNTFIRSVTLEGNMSGQIIENITLPSNSDEIIVSHNLKVVPKYRIILRQRNDGIVIDGDTWDDKKVSFRRDNLTAPAEDLVVSILLMRE
jgi:hypothetical protein